MNSAVTHADVNQYADAYQQDYDFEQHMVAARHQSVGEAINTAKPSSIIEVGCGKALLIDAVNKHYDETLSVSDIDWHIVEPADSFVSYACQQMARYPKLTVHQSMFENWQPPEAFQVDMVVISSLLHEVEKPEALLKQAKRYLKPEGLLVVNVPNANSLHRQLAVALGLIPKQDELTARNLQLHQQRIFDASSLQQLIKAEGLIVKETGGYMLKPFTHKQMAGCLPLLPDNALEGLNRLGQRYPELASEIYCIASNNP